LIDSIGVTSGTITGAAMSEPAAPSADSVKGVFAALNTTEIHRQTSEAPPSSPSSAAILGVDERAVQAALDSL
jgi:ethanolamine utilization microcompartment shell protein EutL